MTHRAITPHFRPHARFGIAGPLTPIGQATRLVRSPTGPAYLVTAEAWPQEVTEGKAPRAVAADDLTFPSDFALRELRLVDVDDDEALADFQQHWGWSGATSQAEVDLLRDVLGETGSATRPEWLDDAERQAEAWPGQEALSRFVTVQTLRDRILIARAVVDTVQAYIVGEPNARRIRRREDTEDARDARCLAAWRAGLTKITECPTLSDPYFEHFWDLQWRTAMDAGINTLSGGTVSTYGEHYRPSFASWYVVVCAEMGQALDVGMAGSDGVRVPAPWSRCANERAHPIDGGWFTTKRSRRRSGHGTPHKIGTRFCSDNCEKATTERKRRSRQRAKAAAQETQVATGGKS